MRASGWQKARIKMEPKFIEPLTKGELELLLHEFKLYLYSLSRHNQNSRLKEKAYVGG